MKTLLPCELSPQSPSLPFIRQFYVKQELCGLRRMETLNWGLNSLITYVRKLSSHNGANRIGYLSISPQALVIHRTGCSSITLTAY